MVPRDTRRHGSVNDQVLNNTFLNIFIGIIVENALQQHHLNIIVLTTVFFSHEQGSLELSRNYTLHRTRISKFWDVHMKLHLE